MKVFNSIINTQGFMPTSRYHRYARVVVPIPVDAPFTYAVPEELADLVCPGVQVIVPFGQRYLGGIVRECTDQAPEGVENIKPIHDVVSPEPFIGPDLLHLLDWIAGYYICHLGEAYRLIHPDVNLHKTALEVRRRSEATPGDLTPALLSVWEQLSTEEWISVARLEKALHKKSLMYRVHRLRQMELAETRYAPPRPKQVFKTEDCFELMPEGEWPEIARNKYLENDQPRYTRAREVIELLREGGTFTREQLRELQVPSALLRRLEKEGVLRRWQVEVERRQEVVFTEEPKAIELTPEQAAFIDRVTPYLRERQEHKAFLLHGITGSGKTQIYIELIRRVLEQGREAILLVPEIVLTPQTTSRFRNEFGDRVAVIHSRISAGERVEVLHKIREGKFSIVIGPRSAVFAPFKHLGLIIVDEEHESSYKQSDGVPHYNARDVALYRAYLNRIPVVLGSATPSFESLYNAETGKYAYFHLPVRIGTRELPRTLIVDCRQEWRRTGAPPIFSENLLLKLEARLLCKEQAMLLQNRRGYSPYILCRECGHIEKCPNCDITLTYHAQGRNLRCHYCGHVQAAPDECPNCRGIDILFKGIGTQRIEEEARARFPHGRILRMDQDTTRRKDDHARLLEKFRRYEADFLIGTRMIAKGLDFGRVTLVGVINADQGLHFPDFRAAEKVFQLLVQAAGRAGRGAQGGEVVIQTFDPDHYIFRYLHTHDYRGFFARELETRKHLNYPPFSRLCLVRISGEAEDQVLHYARAVAKFLWQANKEKRFVVLGPAPAPLARINNRYRYHVLIKQPRDKDPAMTYLRHMLKERLYKNPEVKKWPVSLQIDVDPVDIL